MNFSSWVPQLFYDLIGRVMPGSFLLLIIVWVYDFPIMPYLQSLTMVDKNKDFPYSIIILLTILVSYMIGIFLGGIGFALSKIIDWLKTKRKIEEIAKLLNLKEILWPDPFRVEKLKKTELTIPYAYDYIQHYDPQAGSRLAKLRAEVHLARVLVVGVMLIIIAYVIHTHHLDFKLSVLIGMLLSSFLFWAHLKIRISHLMENCYKVIYDSLDREERLAEHGRQKANPEDAKRDAERS
jgi:hypothetical protein